MNITKDQGVVNQEWRGVRDRENEGGGREVRCESEETFHDEPCDDAFDFTDSTACCIRRKSPDQKSRNKCKHHLQINQKSPGHDKNKTPKHNRIKPSELEQG